MRANAVHGWLKRRWAIAASALLHAVVAAALLIIVPSLTEPLSHSDNSRQVIAIEMVHLAPPPISTPAPPEPPPSTRESAEPPSPSAAMDAPPVLRSPKSEISIPPPAPRKQAPVPKAGPAKKAESSAPPATERPATPAPPTPSQAVAAAAPTGLAGPPPDYLALVRLQLERNKTYPRMAQLRRQEGRVMLRFTIDRDGRVVSHGIDRGSGFTVLDQEAETILTRASPLPPIPADMAQDRLEIIVPIEFQLSGSGQR